MDVSLWSIIISQHCCVVFANFNAFFCEVGGLTLPSVPGRRGVVVLVVETPRPWPGLAWLGLARCFPEDGDPHIGDQLGCCCMCASSPRPDYDPPLK